MLWRMDAQSHAHAHVCRGEGVSISSVKEGVTGEQRPGQMHTAAHEQHSLKSHKLLMR